MARVESEFTVLCEGCGYVVEGLPVDRPCPECGKPIAESVPGARVGSPWQRGPSVGAWWRTVWGVLRSPRRVMGEIQIETARSRRLEFRTTMVAGWLLALPGVMISAAAALREIDSVPGVAVVSIVAATFGVLIGELGHALLLLLTAIERRGIRVFGRARGRRITPAVAEAICAHATAGWVIGGVAWSSTIGLLAALAPMTSPTFDILIWLPVAALLLGLLWFETLVYIGVRRCRFANRIRGGEEAVGGGAGVAVPGGEGRGGGGTAAVGDR